MGSWAQQSTIRGYLCGEVSSALQKCIRRGEEELATWWAAELEQSGYGNMCWNRLETILSEDIGLAWPDGPAILGALRASWERHRDRRLGSHPERLFTQHATMLLARAPKSRRVDHAIWANYGTTEQLYEIPDYALDMFTARGRAMGRTADDWEATSAVLIGEADLGPDPYKDRYLAIDDDSEAAYERQAAANRPPAKNGGMRLFTPDTGDG